MNPRSRRGPTTVSWRSLACAGAITVILLLVTPSGVAWNAGSHWHIMDSALEVENLPEIPSLARWPAVIQKEIGSISVDDNTCLDDPLIDVEGKAPIGLLMSNVGKADLIDPEDNHVINLPHWKWRGWEHNPLCFVNFWDSEDFRQKWGIFLAGPWGNADSRAHEFYDRAINAFSNGDVAMGFFNLAIGAHYVQEMSDPWNSGFGLDIQYYKDVMNVAATIIMAFYCGPCAVLEFVPASDDILLDKFVNTVTTSDVHALFRNYAESNPPSIDGGQLSAPVFTEPGDYVRDQMQYAWLAGIQAGFWTSVKWGRLDDRFGHEGHADDELEKMVKETYSRGAQYAAGYVAHALRQLPRLEAGNVQVGRGADFSLILFDVTNKGQGHARGMEYRLYDEEPCPFSWTVKFWKCVNSRTKASGSVDVAPGQTVTVQIEVRPPIDPSHTYRIQLDPPLMGGCPSTGTYGCFLEVQEVQPPAEPTAEEPQIAYVPPPDLSIVPEDVRPVPGQAGVAYTVRNVGQGPAGRFDVDVYARDPNTGQLSHRCRSTIDGLEPGRFVTAACAVSVTLPVVRVDEAGAVAEVVEAANNQASSDVLVIDRDTYIQGQVVEPLSDVIVLPNVLLTYDGVTLRMRDGARIHVLAGGALTLVATTATAASSGGSYFIQSEGTLNVLDSVVRDLANGIEAGGPRSNLARNTLESLAGGFAVLAAAGKVTLDSNRITGTGGGLLVLPRAEAELKQNVFEANDQGALDLRGGLTTLNGDRLQGSPTLVALATSAAATMENVELEPRTSLRVSGPTTAVQLNGGILRANELTVRFADSAISGNEGRAEIEASQFVTDKLADIGGDVQVLLRDLSAPRTSTVRDQAMVRLDWPLTVNVKGPAPDLLPLPGATVRLTDAQGVELLQGVTTGMGRVFRDLPEFVQTSAGLTEHTPYQLTSTYNAGPGSLVVDLRGPTAVDLVTPVRPDLAPVLLQPAFADGTNYIAARISNLEPARATSAVVEFYANGNLVGTRTVTDVLPGGIANMTLAWTPPEGIFDLEMRINPSGALAEARLDNNVFTTQAWIVDGTESCVTSTAALTGTILVLGELSLSDCDLLLGGNLGETSSIIVMPDGRLEAAAGTRVLASNASIPFSVHAFGDLDLVDAVIEGSFPFVVTGNATIRQSTFRGAEGPALAAVGAELVLEDSQFFGGPDRGGVHIIGGGASLKRNTYHDMGFYAARIENTNRATSQGEVVSNSNIGYVLHNGTYLIEDATLTDRIAHSFRISGSEVELLNVAHDLSTLGIDPGSEIRVAWHTMADVRGVDDEAVPGTTVTVIDRFGQWLGQFNTDGQGQTPDLRLAQFTARDENWNAVIDAAERWAQGPYTLRSGLVQVVRDVTGNGLLPIPQDYRPQVSSNFPFLQFSPDQELTYPLTVKNIGNGNDTMTFALSGVPSGWTAQISSSGATLSPGAQLSLQVTVHAPAQAGREARFNVTATSEDGVTVGRLELSAKTGPNLLPDALAVVRPLAVYRGDVVTFEDHSDDADGFIVQSSWDFGDGYSGEGSVVQHSYNALGAFSARLTTHDNAGGTAVFDVIVHVLNRAPSLSDATITPDQGTTDDSYTFGVTYEDPDDDLPASIHVRLDGFLHALGRIDSEDPRNGTRYEVTLGALERTPHLARFVATDAGGDTVQYPPNADIPAPVVNDPPILVPALDPASGEPDTLFTYRVEYRDLEGDAPAYVHLVVDDAEPLPLVREDPFESDFVNGVTYVGRLTLETAGVHSYRFEASDGLRTSTTGVMSGPSVQAAPSLVAPSASPDQAVPGSVFTFRVLYRDAQGQVPLSVRTIVDQRVLTMTPVDENPDVVAGAMYEVQTTLDVAGRQPFWFEAHLPTATLRLPEAGSFDGPIVNVAPVAGLEASPSLGTVLTDFVLNASASYDPDAPQAPLEVQVEWGDGSTSPWIRSTTLVHRYQQPGTYQVRLVSRDIWGAVSAPASETVRVEDQLPTASFDVLPASGMAEEGDGLGTQFAFRPGGVGDLEDSLDELLIRWDFDGDNVWDTGWLQGLGLAYHSYELAGEYRAAIEVRDSANHIVPSTHDVIVGGTHPLSLNEIVERSMTVTEERHYYKLEVPEDLINIFAVMNEEVAPGVDFALYVQRGEKPNPDDCDPSDCVEGGPGDRACWRVPEPGTYYVLVVADLLQPSAADYTLQVRPNHLALGDASTLARCAAFGPTPEPT